MARPYPHDSAARRIPGARPWKLQFFRLQYGFPHLCQMKNELTL